MTLPIYQSFINGQPLANQSGERFDVVNPATGQVIYQVEQADESIMQAAVASAEEGFKTWSAMTGLERGRILNRAAAMLREQNDALAMIEVRDAGKPWQEASVVDVVTGADAVEYCGGQASSIVGESQQIGPDFFYTRREPLGVCAGIGAWNYPLQIACWKSAPALASGNSMIFKPSEETPLGAIKLAEIYLAAGVPAGVFNVVQGDYRVGQMLTSDPAIAKVSFTGEAKTGRTVMADSARTLKSVTMELGGKSPLIIFDDTNLEQAVSAAMLGNFYTQGEICTNGTRVFVQRKIYDAFLAELVERTENNIIAGDPENPNTNFGALISAGHRDLVMKYINSAKTEGARLLTGGAELQPAGFENGYFVAPTVFADCTDDMTIVREEIFGPVVTVTKFKSLDEVVDMANDSEYGLAAGIHTLNINTALKVADRLKAGTVWINTYNDFHHSVPFGGFNASGLGREMGAETLENYTQVKAVRAKLV